MRIAIIDLGTNTFNILIVETDASNTYKQIFQTKIAVKLGEGAINLGYIADVPFKRGMDAVIHYQGLCFNIKSNRPMPLLLQPFDQHLMAKNL